MKKQAIMAFLGLLAVHLMGGWGKTSELGTVSLIETATEAALVTKPNTELMPENEENVFPSTLNLEFCGESLTFPCKIRDFGADISLKEGFYFEDQDYTVCDLYTSDDRLICTAFLNGKQQNDPAEQLVCGITFDSKDTLIALTGLQEAAEGKFIETFGEPDIHNDDYIEYNSGKILLSVLFDDETGRPKHTMISLVN